MNGLLSEQQQEAILSAIEAEANKLVPHKTVIEKHKKLANAL